MPQVLRDMMTTLAMMIAMMMMMMADRKVNRFIEHRPGAECEEIPT